MPCDPGLIEIIYKFPEESVISFDNTLTTLTDGTVIFLPIVDESHKYYHIMDELDSTSIIIFIRCNNPKFFS